jgi:hypothetical protein
VFRNTTLKRLNIKKIEGRKKNSTSEKHAKALKNQQTKDRAVKTKNINDLQKKQAKLTKSQAVLP